MSFHFIATKKRKAWNIPARAKPVDIPKVEIPKHLKGVKKVMKPKSKSLTWKSLIAGILSVVLTFVIKTFIPETFEPAALKIVSWVLELIFGASVLGMAWGIRRTKGDIL